MEYKNYLALLHLRTIAISLQTRVRKLRNQDSGSGIYLLNSSAAEAQVRVGCRRKTFKLTHANGLRLAAACVCLLHVGLDSFDLEALRR